MSYDPKELKDERKREIEDLLAPLGVHTNRLDLINQALTHRSYAFENPPAEDNERLEFLGDSVLGFVIADFFYQRYPDADEGDLSKKKARVVSRTLLGQLAEQLRMGDAIRLGRGEEQSGGRQRPSLLGSTLEALIGAVYLAEGLDEAARFIREQLIERLLDMLEEEEAWDYKSRLQEYVQKKFQTTPVYETVATSGPDHHKSFTVRVSILDKPYGEDTASRKKAAENLAAKAALEILEKEDEQ
jgi:ribonuclease III